jgi:hypothetical protein
MRYIISTWTADEYPDLVEQIQNACNDWQAAGYPGRMSAEVSLSNDGVILQVVERQPTCAHPGAAACTESFPHDMQHSSILIWAQTKQKWQTIVSHEMGHTLGLDDLPFEDALMYGWSERLHPTKHDRDALAKLANK